MTKFEWLAQKLAFPLTAIIILSLVLVACGDASPAPGVATTTIANPTVVATTAPVATSSPVSVNTTASAASTTIPAVVTSLSTTAPALTATTAAATRVPTSPTTAAITTAVSATVSPRPSLSPIPVPTVVASAQVQQTLDVIGQQAVKTRRLEFKSKVEKNFMTREALGKYQLESFNRDNPPEEVAKYQKINEVFGFLPKGFDLAKAYTDLQTEQVLGFYDPRTKKLYLIIDQDPNKVSPLVKYTAEHELTHALQDQNYDIQKLRPIREPNATEGNDDQDYALTALLEGDAVNSQTVWIQAGNLSRQELSQMITEVQSFNQDKLNNAPLILKDTLSFPYAEGSSFVQNIYKKGGWDAVNKMFSDYTPRSTAQILHPEKYEKRIDPVKVELPSLVDTLGQGWKSLDINTMGELQSRIWLNGVLSTEEAKKAVSGWSGDRYQVLSDAQDNYGYAWRSQWDSEGDASNFFKASLSSVTRLYGLSGDGGTGLKRNWTSTDKDVSLVQKGNQVLVVVLPKGNASKVTARLGF